MSTFPDKLFELSGVPVGGGRYEGMWEGKAHFVDYDNGASGADGTSAKSPGKYLQTAIDQAGPWDVIYVRPRDPAAGSGEGGGSNYITPESTSNWSIPYTAYGLSIIGSAPGNGRNAGMLTHLRGGAVTTASPVMCVKSCWNNFENLAFHSGASLESQLQFKRTATATDRAYGNSVTNCTFRFGAGLIADHLQGCIHIESSSYDKILNCTFSAAPIPIVVRTSLGSVQHLQIIGCHFQSTAAETCCDVFSGGTLTNFCLKDCTFGHAVPALASVVITGKYIHFGAACTGLVANCFTGALDATIADNMTLNGVLYTNIWGDGVGPMVDV